MIFWTMKEIGYIKYNNYRNKLINQIVKNIKYQL